MFDSWITWYSIPLLICLVSSGVFYKMSRWAHNACFVTASGVVLGLGLVPFFNILMAVALVLILSALGGLLVVTTVVRVLKKR